MTATQSAGGSQGDGPLATARQRFLRGFINLKTMPLPVRIPTLAVFGLLGIVAAALAVYDLPQPHVAMPLQLTGQATQTSLLALIILVAVGGIGFAYALAGAMSLR